MNKPLNERSGWIWMNGSFNGWEDWSWKRAIENGFLSINNLKKQGFKVIGIKLQREIK